MQHSANWKVLAGMVVEFGVVTVMLGVYIGGDSVSSAVTDSVVLNRRSLDVVDLSSTSHPLHRYRCFFKSQAEIDRIRAIEERVRNHTATTPLNNCEFKCVGPNSSLLPETSLEIKATDDDWIAGNDSIYHGCCTSEKKRVSPKTAKNADGKRVLVVQTTTLKQYFVTETCEQQSGCTGCRCGQPVPFVYDAVVYANNVPILTEKNLKEEAIVLPGCCKCLNI